VTGSPGIGFYVAIVGAIVAATGLMVMRRAAETHLSSTKRCPDCAEEVQREARVCKHCGFHFADVEREDAAVLRSVSDDARPTMLADLPAPESTVADWYSDPVDDSALRFWDGSVWTLHTRQPDLPQQGE